MFELALQQLKTKQKHILFFFGFFMIINSVVDYLNVPYSQMINQYGLYLVVINILLNIVMSSITAVMLTLSIINVNLKGNETKSSNFGFLSVLFSIMTYGCTSCVISFLAIFGISYSVALLPLAGLPYKLLTLGILITGLLFTRYEINKPCKIKTTK